MSQKDGLMELSEGEKSEYWRTLIGSHASLQKNISMDPELSIIIVSWNTRELLIHCLESLPSACGTIPYEVLIVDNASSDGSLTWLRGRSEQIKLIANEKNLGFAAANNQAAKLATGRYLLLLNPDTEAHAHSIAQMVAFADEHPDIAAIGPHLLNTDGSNQRSCWRGFPGLGMAFVDALYLWKLPLLPLSWVSEYRPDELRAPRDVGHLLGASMLIRRAVWDQVGPLDEAYFLGLEETDWCYRTRQAGWRIVYDPEPTMVHHGQRSTRQEPEKMLPHMYAGYFQFYRKYHRSHNSIIILSAVHALGAWLRIALWNARRIRARDDGQRQEAAAMTAAYHEVLCQLASEWRKPHNART